jgi:hypothetical protein
MNEKRSYRLGKYRITEYDNLLLSWERHDAVAEQRSGKCFICGEVLIIGQCSYQETGYLIGEFHDQTQKLPVWDKTRYYCFSSSLLDVATGYNPANDFLEQRLSFVDINSPRIKSVITPAPSIFRLGRYRITVAADGKVDWQTHEGLNRTAGGRCIVEPGLLFIGPQEYDEEGQGKQEFLSTLDHLPKWDKTIAWGHYEVLRVCRDEQQTEKSGVSVWSRSAWSYRSFDNKPSVTSQTDHERTYKILLQSGLNWLKTASHYLREERYWFKYFKYLMTLLAAGLLFVFFIIIYSAEKIFHWFHRPEEHHQKHDD